jgi:hypothetical protein
MGPGGGAPGGELGNGRRRGLKGEERIRGLNCDYS